jgi:integrase
MWGRTMNEPEIPSSKRRPQRVRSPHPGVKLKRPQPAQRRDYWRAVYVDPDTGKTVYERLDPSVLTTDKARLHWAKRKSDDLAKRVRELADGAVRATGTSVEDGIKLFFQNMAHIRDSTHVGYTASANTFLSWCDAERVTLDTLNRAKLIEFRAYALKQPWRRPVKNGERGERKAVDGKRRSVVTVNRDLRVTRIILGWLHKADRLPKLSRQDLEIALERYKEPENVPEYLPSHDLRGFLEACDRHDADTFVLTRWHRQRFGQRKGGPADTTARHKPISPLVMAAMLTGMRLDELCLLEWRTHVDLNAIDHTGKVVGEIRLRAQDTKTHKSRTVAFDVSQALRDLFHALKAAGDGTGSVFNLTFDETQKALKRLRNVYGAPERANYQMLRSTCSTFLTNAPSIYGAAAPFHSARQLGHSVEVAQKHYTGLIRGIPKEATTLEAAMQIEAECAAVIAHVKNQAAHSGNVVSLRGANKRQRAGFSTK